MTEYTRRTGLIFRAGDYPDKRFAMTPAELAEAAAAFEPCPVDLEHVDTVLSGKLGRLESVSVGEDGATLFGTVALPTWLDALLEDGQRKVSCTWDRATKRLAALALVRQPRVSDAALLSAFSAASAGGTGTGLATIDGPDDADFAGRRHDTMAGRYQLQALHDQAASAGAICTKGAAMSSKHEGIAIQQIHDLAVAHGARCDGGSDRPAMYAADEEGEPMPTEQEQALSLWQTIKALFAGKPAEGEGQPAATPTADLSAGDGAGDDAEKVALTARVAELEAADAAREAGAREAREAGFRASADAFADAEIAASRALPAEREAIVAAHLQAGRDDAAHGTADFAAGGSRVATLSATFAARQPHRLTEALVAGGATVLATPAATMQAGADQPMSDERRKALYALLPELEAIEKERAGK